MGDLHRRVRAAVFDWVAGYDRAHLRGDLVAGLTVGAMLIPQSMGYALLAGLPPQIGLYAAVLPLVVYAAIGGVPQLGGGPPAASSPPTAAGLARLSRGETGGGGARGARVAGLGGVLGV